MPVAMNDDEIKYGPKKFGQKDLLITSGLVLAGVFLIWSGVSDQVSGGFSFYCSSKSFAAGVLAIILGIAGAVLMISNKRRNVPHVTMYSTGLSYAMSTKVVLESRWDSVGPFELVYNTKGKLHSIQAPITGENISDSLKRDNKFGIYFLTLLDVAPTVLMNELNQVRANALAKIDAP